MVACCGSPSVRPGDKTTLADGWTLHSDESGQTYPATVPSTVAGTLFDNGVYSEADFRDDNYRKLDKTPFDSPWTYTKIFSGKGMKGRHVFLQFDGTDDAVFEQLRGRALLAEKEKAMENAKALENVVVKITARAGAAGKLFGAVTSQEISDALREQHGIEIEKQKIVQAEPIKNYGSYEVKCKFGYEISGTIHLLVVEEK